jgi:hypothetical protein
VLERDEGFDEAPPVALANLLQSTQRFKKDTPEMLRELKFFLKKYLLCTSAVYDLLESLDKHFDLELMKKTVKMLSTLGMVSNQHTYEVFLTINCTMENFTEVRALVADLCQRALMHLSYAIGISKPLSLFAETYGMEQDGLTFSDVANFVKTNSDRRPGAVAQSLALPEPKHQETAAYGHFGREPYMKIGMKFPDWQ